MVLLLYIRTDLYQFPHYQLSRYIDTVAPPLSWYISHGPSKHACCSSSWTVTMDQRTARHAFDPVHDMGDDDGEYYLNGCQ